MRDTRELKTREYPDGITVFVDPGTVKKKKNRWRHCKDGTPKRMRGIPRPEMEVSE